MQPLGRDTPAGHGPGYVLRRPPRHRRVGRVAEAQLQAGAEQVADGRPEVHPAGRAGHHVDAVGQAPGGQVGDRRFEVVILAPDRAPAVDDQEHLGPALPCSVAGPLPLGEQRGDLADRAPYRRRLLPAGHPADVR